MSHSITVTRFVVILLFQAWFWSKHQCLWRQVDASTVKTLVKHPCIKINLPISVFKSHVFKRVRAIMYSFYVFFRVFFLFWSYQKGHTVHRTGNGLVFFHFKTFCVNNKFSYTSCFQNDCNSNIYSAKKYSQSTYFSLQDFHFQECLVSKIIDSKALVLSTLSFPQYI